MSFSRANFNPGHVGSGVEKGLDVFDRLKWERIGVTPSRRGNPRPLHVKRRLQAHAALDKAAATRCHAMPARREVAKLIGIGPRRFLKRGKQARVNAQTTRKFPVF
jgi:hypothetical protein